MPPETGRPPTRGNQAGKVKKVPGTKEMAAKTTTAATKLREGASQKTKRSALAGMMSSLRISFSTSARRPGMPRQYERTGTLPQLHMLLLRKPERPTWPLAMRVEPRRCCR